MACSLTVTLISEQQVGNCGEDWKYDLDVQVLHEGLRGQGRFHVPRHNLKSGDIREPHGAPEPQLLYSGDCLTELLVRIQLTATEVDLFMNDVGKSSQDLVIACPAPGSDKTVKEVDISAEVHETPRFLSRKTAEFKVRLRFALVCDRV
jgi:hypothetical protein